MAKKSAHLTEDPRATRRPSVRSHPPERVGSDVPRGMPLSVQGIADLQRTAGNRAVGELLVQRSANGVVVQRDDYPYGSARTTPHIHRYPKGAHLKILDGEKIRRINLIQDGKRYSQGVAEAFELARASRNMTGRGHQAGDCGSRSVRATR